MVTIVNRVKDTITWFTIFLLPSALAQPGIGGGLK